jgi:hypothetical protein
MKSVLACLQQVICAAGPNRFALKILARAPPNGRAKALAPKCSCTLSPNFLMKGSKIGHIPQWSSVVLSGPQ